MKKQLFKEGACTMEKEITIPSEYALSGTLTIPSHEKKKYPAVLIMSGSGEGDRDGNFKKLNLRLYQEIADFLTSKGFVTLRYDKRGTHKSEGNYYETGLYDMIDDGVAGVKFLIEREQVDENNVFILGHSEGALLAPAVYERVSVSGLILLAGAATDSKSLSHFQREKMYREIHETKGFKGWFFRAFRVADKLKQQNEKVLHAVLQSEESVMKIKGMKVNAKWLRETLSYNVCDYLEKVTCPVLSITGEKDIQVPPEHAKVIAEMVQGEAEWHIIPNMNHIFRDSDKEHTMFNIIKEYQSVVHKPINAQLLELVKTWLHKQLRHN